MKNKKNDWLEIPVFAVSNRYLMRNMSDTLLLINVFTVKSKILSVDKLFYFYSNNNVNFNLNKKNNSSGSTGAAMLSSWVHPQSFKF